MIGKISAKYSDVLFKVFLTLIMSTIMAFVITLLNIGYTEQFFEKVTIAFVGGFITSFPAILIAVPLAKRFVKKLTIAKKNQSQAF